MGWGLQHTITVYVKVLSSDTVCTVLVPRSIESIISDRMAYDSAVAILAGAKVPAADALISVPSPVPALVLGLD